MVSKAKNAELIKEFLGVAPISCLWVEMVAEKGNTGLDVILHLGAHRTGSTSFQRLLQENRQKLNQNGVAFWGPQITRNGRFSGLLRATGANDRETARLIRRNKGQIAIEMQRLQDRGITRLIVSEENMLGTMRGNLEAGQLYPRQEERLGRFVDAFAGQIVEVALTIRAYTDYWNSVLGFGAGLAFTRPDHMMIARLASLPRTWKSVVLGLEKTFEAAQISVFEFDDVKSRPEAILAGLQTRMPALGAFPGVHNAGPEAASRAKYFKSCGLNGVKGSAFDADQTDDLRNRYQRDLSWLAMQGRPDQHETRPAMIGSRRGVA